MAAASLSALPAAVLRGPSSVCHAALVLVLLGALGLLLGLSLKVLVLVQLPGFVRVLVAALLQVLRALGAPLGAPLWAVQLVLMTPFYVREIFYASGAAENIIEKEMWPPRILICSFWAFRTSNLSVWRVTPPHGM